ncbi:MAG: cell division protein ZapD [Steroidobacteraceae bacterium]|nr:cell division protein ZapD [Steroidobacteraceae bacterium]
MIAATAGGASAAELYFEQPLNERLRTYLRLDFLFNQALHHNRSADAWGSRAAIASLIDMLSITTRSDIRADVLKELERQQSVLQTYARRPGVDKARLQAIIGNLARLRNELLEAGGVSQLQVLKESEFLAAIRHRNAIPGGTCEFDLPDFAYWLQRDDAERRDEFAQWLALFRPLCDAIAELLWLTRQSGRTTDEIARGGVYHVTFDRDTPVQLVRIGIAADNGLYPEISGSHYRCSVRFVSWQGLQRRAAQTTDDVPFRLICCT